MRRLRRRRLTALAGVLGLLAAGSTVALSAAPAGATTVNDEASLRIAFGNAAETQIDLSADITLTTCPNGNVTRPNTAGALVVDGHGHTVTQTCATGFSGVFILGPPSVAALTFQNITITGGTAPSTGGGISTDGAVSLTNATVRGNSAGAAGGGGGIFAAGGVSLTNSTVSGNTTGSGSVGGGIFAGGLLTVTNSTISGNTSAAGGGALFSTGSVALVYATIAGNSSPNQQIAGGSAMSSFGSVVALPAGGGIDCSTTTTSNGYNWDDDGTCGFGAGPGDHSNGGNPQLGALASNGGLTQTRMPLTGSPLIDAIVTSACSSDGASSISPLIDQIGSARPQGSGCDIGSVEVLVAVPAPIVARFTG